MGKSKSGSGDRAAKVAKAGKRSGQTVYPAPISAERRAAKEQGERQFIAKSSLSVPRTKTVIVYDKALQGFVERSSTVHINTEHIWDTSRGRVITNPKFKEAK